MDGRLTAGSVMRSAPATAVPKPRDKKVAIIGISAAVGITNRVPAIAKIITAKIPFILPAPSVGNIQARAAPSSRTVTK
ncbi:hypothetical protein D3C81_1877270 [compost metagenome]